MHSRTAVHTVDWVVAKALANERALSGRRVAVIRLGAGSLVFAVCVYFGLIQGDYGWRVYLELFGIYLAVALLLVLVSRRSGMAARWLGLAVILIDVPIVYWLQRLAMPASPFPAGVAGFTL